MVAEDTTLGFFLFEKRKRPAERLMDKTPTSPESPPIDKPGLSRNAAIFWGVVAFLAIAVL